MYLLVVGINYRTAPVEVREKFTFTDEEMSEALTLLKNKNSILECSILTTCNRTEFHCIVNHLHSGQRNILIYLQDYFGICRNDFEDYIYTYSCEQAVKHILCVTCGLDSMIFGETQILGQICSAYEKALEENTIGTILKQLLPQAISFGKRCHSELNLSSWPASIGDAAIELCKRRVGSFAGKVAMIIGAGETSKLAARHLYSQGIKQIYIINRTFSNAEHLAKTIDAIAIDWNEMVNCLTNVDVVISSTSSKQYILDKKMIQDIVKQRNHNPLYIVDIAVPRDINPDVLELENVFLDDIDKLICVNETNTDLKAKEFVKIDAMIEEEMQIFEDWINTLDVIPLIKAMKHKTDAIYENTLTSLFNKLPNLAEREKRLIRKHTKSIINQILKNPILMSKEMAGQDNAKEQIDLVAEMFGLTAEIEKYKEPIKFKKL